jgi:RNA polymerase sigma factor (sigma-70 family)
MAALIPQAKFRLDWALDDDAPRPATKFLSKDELFDHAQRVEAGVCAKHALEQDDDLTPQRREELEILADEGQESMMTLLRTHVKFVKKLAWRKRFTVDSTRDPQELVEAGMRGLLRAVRKYDYRKGYTLTTYADAWVRRYIAQDVYRYDWRVTDDEGSRLSAMRVAREALTVQLQREPKRAELAQHIKVSPHELKDLLLLEQRATARGVDIDEVVRRVAAQETQKDVQVVLSKGVRLSLEQALHDQPHGMELLYLRFIEENTIKEMSQRLNIPPAQIGIELKQVLAVLKERVDYDRIQKLLA